MGFFDLFKEKNKYALCMKEIKHTIYNWKLRSIYIERKMETNKSRHAINNFVKRVASKDYDYQLTKKEKRILTLYDLQFGDIVAEATSIINTKYKVNKGDLYELTKVIYESLDTVISEIERQDDELTKAVDAELDKRLENNISTLETRIKHILGK